MSAELTDHERAVLVFAKTPWRYPGMKEQAIRELFGMSPTSYYQQLNAIIDRDEAEIAEPQLVRRLRRLRDTKAARSGRR